MARKSARALAATEAAAARNESDDDAAAGKVSLSDLSVKSCLTCGRVITPRAKWIKDWAGIKYCSDRCRTTRPGKVVASFTAASNVASLEGIDGIKVDAREVSVDVETFVETVLLDLSKKRVCTLEDAQESIESMLKEALIPLGQCTRRDRNLSDREETPVSEKKEDLHPLWKALDGPPGLRERIRRAARRLALGITHDSDPQQTNITTTDNGVIELLQGGKVLRTVEDLSFAKGVINIRRKR